MGLTATLRNQWIGIAGVIIGLSGVAFGATGQPAVLGRLNQADKPTVFQNTAGGPAVAFKGGADAPPFTVDSRAQVPRLNAARVGGRLPSSFARAGASYTKAESDARYGEEGVVELTVLMEDTYTAIAETLFDDGFAPSAPGTLTLRAFGRCSSDAAPGSMVLEIDGAATGTSPLNAPACDNSVSAHLAAGEFRFVSVRVVPASGTDPTRLVGGVAVLTFVPD